MMLPSHPSKLSRPQQKAVLPITLWRLIWGALQHVCPSMTRRAMRAALCMFREPPSESAPARVLIEAQCMLETDATDCEPDGDQYPAYKLEGMELDTARTVPGFFNTRGQSFGRYKPPLGQYRQIDFYIDLPYDVCADYPHKNFAVTTDCSSSPSSCANVVAKHVSVPRRVCGLEYMFVLLMPATSNLAGK
eukprot:TRINITY_DN9739_c0_g1_i1.p2 TRINITY_DN9739_c0_g1~~TRINITY_DN9739_c0_g1_i1.p2  ORF type:complete len:191 (+),score=12.04 TRINITY_DN9739_c0_g1_i1:1809-2381(+)